MDSELTSLTRTAGSTLVTLMASDGWRAARDLVLRWWRRAQPGRAETIAAELDASHEDATGGASGGDPVAGDGAQAGGERAVRDPAGPGPLAGDPVETGDTGEADDADDTGEAGEADTAAELRAQWQGLFRRALAACPEAADDLRRLLAELEALAAGAPTPPSAGRHITVTQHAKASGSARVLQAGRDQHVSGR